MDFPSAMWWEDPGSVEVGAYGIVEKHAQVRFSVGGIRPRPCRIGLLRLTSAE